MRKTWLMCGLTLLTVGCKSMQSQSSVGTAKTFGLTSDPQNPEALASSSPWDSPSPSPWESPSPSPSESPSPNPEVISEDEPPTPPAYDGGSAGSKSLVVAGRVIVRSPATQGSNPQAIVDADLDRVLSRLTSAEAEGVTAEPLFIPSSQTAPLWPTDLDPTDPNAGTMPLYTVVTIPLLSGSSDANILRTLEVISQLNAEIPGSADRDIIATKSLFANDPYLPPSTNAWGQDFLNMWGTWLTDVQAAWDISLGQGQIVAVIDTGVDASHEDLSGQVLSGFDTRTSGTNTSDSDGHGTHIAGIIAAKKNNAKGVAGVAPEAKILPVRVFDPNGNTGSMELAKGIIWAVNNGASVINLSISSSSDPEFAPTIVADALKYAYSRGVVVIAAAGNSSSNVVSTFPANSPYVLAVSAVDETNTFSSFSNYGTRIGLSAPGGGNPTGLGHDFYSVLSTKSAVISQNLGTSLNVGTNYLLLSGTSMAAPFVAGAAALIRAKNPTFTPFQVFQALRLGTDDIGTPGYDREHGPGRLNVLKALQQTSPLGVWISSVVPAYQYSGNTLTVQGVVSGSGISNWALEYGIGDVPGMWTSIATGTASVNGVLKVWTLPSNLFGSLISVRLRAINTAGKIYESRAETIFVENRGTITISPPIFGSVALGSSKSKLIYITNSGYGDVTNLNISFTNSQYNFVGGVFPGTQGTCAATLRRRTDCYIMVELRPTSVGPVIGNLSVTYFSQQSTASGVYALTGSGVVAAANVIAQNPTGDYGSVNLTKKVTRTFAFINVGAIAAAGLQWTLTGSGFSYVGGAFPGTNGTCSTTLAVGATCRVFVELSTGPLPQVYSGQLTWAYSSSGSTTTQSLQLRAVGYNETPWRNAFNPVDVNKDGYVSPLDALLVVNALNATGARRLDSIGPQALPRFYYDVSGDGYLSALDSLLVINYLNSR